MCGICGSVGGDVERESESVRAMSGAIAHRGPDDHGIVVDGPSVLGNRRLAILDLSSTGHQPLGDATRGTWITYNGEIYNHAELRRELEATGHRFRGTSDTEVILALYLRDGPALLSRLRGMFAFAIWDQRRQRLFAARDHFGQKPFYYAQPAGRLLFASEIKALLAHPDVTAHVEPAAIDYYLSLRMIPPPLTMFRGISKLPAGHCLEWSQAEGLRIRSYWTPDVQQGPSRSDGEWIEMLRAALVDSVEAHRTSDVPIGAFLSGGLDSSVVVALLSRQGQVRLPTFCIGSDSPAFDERPLARLMATHCGTEHHERAVSAKLLTSLPRLVHTLDEPSDPIAACFEAAAQLASEHVKVVLGGDGGDEMFGGFDRYAAFEAAAWYAALPRWLREGVIRPVIRGRDETFGYKTLSQRARWLDEVSSEGGGRLYARMTSHFRFSPERKGALYGPGLRDQLAGVDALSTVAVPFEQARASTPLDRMLYADLVTRLPEHTLMLADRLAMARGLEVRSPLLDVPLAEVSLKMPARLRVRRGRTKVALRRAAAGWIPGPLLQRGKQGFMFPVADWLDATTLPGIASYLINGPLTRDGWIQADAVTRLSGEHAARRADHHVRLWQLLSLDSWHRRYLGGESHEEQTERLTHGLDPLAQAGMAPHGGPHDR
jgi:asparagine synthase (glutamine-hydrolysing)